jgi:hypothetical protein
MFEPSRRIADDAASPLVGGTRSMYCSPTADTLFTVAVTFSGTGVSLLSRMCARTPSLSRPTDSTRPTVTPRYVTLAFWYSPPPATNFAVTL